MRWNGRVRLLFGKSEYPALTMMVVMCLILLSPFVSVYLNYAAFAICIYRMVRYDAKVFVTDYCILTPVCQFFRMAEGMTLLIWLCLVAAIWYLVRGKIVGNTALVVLLLFLNYLLTRMQMNINDFVLCFGQMLALYVLLPKQDAKSAERAIKAFCWSLLITSIYALVFRNSSPIVAIRGEDAVAIWGTSIMRFSGLIKDPNYYMTLILVGLAALCKMKEAGKIKGAFFWIMGAALATFGILSYSKTFFVVFVLLGGLYIISQFWNRKVFKGVAFAVLAIVAGLYLLLDEGSPFAVVLQRLTSADSLNDLTTGRYNLYIRYWNAIWDNGFSFLFGYGLNAPVLGKGAHNIFLEIAYYFGIVGLALIALFYGAMLKRINSTFQCEKRQGFISKYIVLIIVLVQYCALHGMFQVITHAGLFVAFLSFYITPKNARIECGE